MQNPGLSSSCFPSGLLKCTVIRCPHLSDKPPTASTQNCAARLVTGTRKTDHTTPILDQLHWLPIRYRALYGILFYKCKVLNRTAPVHLSDLVQNYKPVRLL